MCVQQQQQQQAVNLVQNTHTSAAVYLHSAGSSLTYFSRICAKPSLVVYTLHAVVVRTNDPRNMQRIPRLRQQHYHAPEA